MYRLLRYIIHLKRFTHQRPVQGFPCLKTHRLQRCVFLIQNKMYPKDISTYPEVTKGLEVFEVKEQRVDVNGSHGHD